MTTALIIVESYFGSTRTVAKAIASGLVDGGAEAQVVDVAQTPSTLPAEVDLLVVGAPTHNRGLPTAATRAKAREQTGTSGASRGVLEWLGTTAIPAPTTVAAFDTVVSRSWLSGSAAKAIAKALRQHQGRETSSVRSFVVTANKGPLADGEETGARTWGRELAVAANSR